MAQKEALVREAARRKSERTRLASLLSKLVKPDEDGFLSSRGLRRQLRMYWGKPPRLDALVEALIPLGAQRYGQYDGKWGWRGVSLVADGDALYHQVRAHYGKTSDELDISAKAERPTGPQVSQLAREWEAKLESEGMPAELPMISEIKKHGPEDLQSNTFFRSEVLRGIANRQATELAEDLFSDYVWHKAKWSDFPEWERRACERWTIDGSTVREIADYLDNVVGFRTVSKCLMKHRARAGVLGKGPCRGNP